MTTYGTATYNGTSYTLYGRPGSTIIDEVNRLANGGEYPTYDKYLDVQGAINKWAGTSGEAIIAALNHKASATRKPNVYREMNTICNELAGIVSSPADPSKLVEAVTALRTIAS